MADLTSWRNGVAQRTRRSAAAIGPLRRARVWWRKEARPFWRDVRWVVIGLVAVAALVLGYSGFEEYFDAAGESRSFGDKLYLSLQLFGLESGDVAPVPRQLEVARVLAPVVAVYAAISAVAALLREQLHLLRVRFLRGHVVVCGLGGRGLALAKGFNRRGDRVVAIETDDDARGIGECREEGISVLIGDATDRAMLRKARVRKARYLIAVGSDDGVDAEVAANLSDLMKGRGGKPLTAFVHVTDPNLCGLLRRGAAASDAADAYRLEFFSVYEIAALDLVSTYMPMTGDDGAGGMVVVGVGQMGEALVIHAAKAWQAVHAPSGRRLPVTLVDDEAERKSASLLERHRPLCAACDLRCEQMDIKEAKFSQAEFLFDRSGRPAAAVFICLGDDALGIRAAQAILPAVRPHGIPVVVRMSQHAGLAHLLDEDTAGEGAECLETFPLLDRTSTPEILLDGTRELLARRLYEEQAGDSAPPWEKLDERSKRESRCEADRLALKLSLLRFGLEPLTDWDDETARFTPNEVGTLAMLELEHRFEYHRSETSPEQREADRAAAEALPAFLAQAGLRVYRLDG